MKVQGIVKLQYGRGTQLAAIVGKTKTGQLQICRWKASDPELASGANISPTDLRVISIESNPEVVLAQLKEWHQILQQRLQSLSFNPSWSARVQRKLDSFAERTGCQF